MAFRIRKPSQESFFALNAIPLYSYAIPLLLLGGLSLPSLRFSLPRRAAPLAFARLETVHRGASPPNPSALEQSRQRLGWMFDAESTSA